MCIDHISMLTCAFPLHAQWAQCPLVSQRAYIHIHTRMNTHKLIQAFTHAHMCTGIQVYRISGT